MSLSTLGFQNLRWHLAQSFASSFFLTHVSTCLALHLRYPFIIFEAIYNTYLILMGIHFFVDAVKYHHSHHLSLPNLHPCFYQIYINRSYHLMLRLIPLTSVWGLRGLRLRIKIHRMHVSRTSSSSCRCTSHEKSSSIDNIIIMYNIFSLQLLNNFNWIILFKSSLNQRFFCEFRVDYEIVKIWFIKPKI